MISIAQNVRMVTWSLSLLLWVITRALSNVLLDILHQRIIVLVSILIFQDNGTLWLGLHPLGNNLAWKRFRVQTSVLIQCSINARVDKICWILLIITKSQNFHFILPLGYLESTSNKTTKSVNFALVYRWRTLSAAI